MTTPDELTEIRFVAYFLNALIDARAGSYESRISPGQGPSYDSCHAIAMMNDRWILSEDPRP